MVNLEKHLEGSYHGPIEEISRDLPGETEDNHKTTQSG
jgi:hypothetical protein